MKELQRKGYPPEKWYVPPERFSKSEKKDGSGDTKINGTVLMAKRNCETTTTHKPEHKEYFEWLKEILESDDEETKHSIISNLKTFVRTVRMNSRLLQLERFGNNDNSEGK